MPTLLLRLVGPMQSWGIQSNYTHRDTALEPSKSGVIGLICAALGRPRSEPIADLAGLKMGVRVDREGLVLRDYHTAQAILKAGGGIKGTELSDRFYLADAAFLAGLQGDDAGLLGRIQEALRHPHWMLCLGRKAFVPGEPVALPGGFTHEHLREALIRYQPRLRPKRHSLDDDRVRLMLEDEAGEIARRDQPLSFEEGNRRFTVRRLRVEYCRLSEPEEAA
jgi:CRISPR system Cascade subunit CasD